MHLVCQYFGPVAGEGADSVSLDKFQWLWAITSGSIGSNILQELIFNLGCQVVVRDRLKLERPRVLI